MQWASELAEQWQRNGKDPPPVAGVMNQVEPLLRQGKFKEAAAVLDRGLSLLGASRNGDSDQPASPADQPPGSSRPAERAEGPAALRAQVETLSAPHAGCWAVSCETRRV